MQFFVKPQLNPTSGRCISGLQGASSAFLLSKLRKSPKNTWLVLVDTQEAAEKLCLDFQFFFEGDPNEISVYPLWDVTPFDAISPNPNEIIGRLEIFHDLLQGKTPIIISTIEAVLQKCIPQEVFLNHCFQIQKGQEVEHNGLIQKLMNAGYARVNTVEDVGTFSVRGGLIDIYPPLTKSPFRLEFLGDEVETIRKFDPATQRTLEKDILSFSILPVQEILFHAVEINRTKNLMKTIADEAGIEKSKREQVFESLDHEILTPGVEFCLPLFYEEVSTLFDYLPGTFDVFYMDRSEIERHAIEFEKTCHSAHDKALQSGHIVSPVSDLYLSPKEFFEKIETQKFINFSPLQIDSNTLPTEHFQTETHDDLRYLLAQKKITSLEILKPLVQKIENWRDLGFSIYFLAHTQTQLKRFEELFRHYHLKLRRVESLQTAIAQIDIHLCLGAISKGFVFHDEKIVFLAEEDVFGKRRHSKETKQSIKAPFLTSLAELNLNDPIIHVENGVGRYLGLEKLTIGGYESDFLCIEYALQDKLYLPVHRLNMVQRYVGSNKETLRLDRLGGLTWQKTKKRVKRSIEEIAHELLEIYAARKLQKGHAFQPPDSYFHEMEATFPYEETTDQLKAIEDVLKDLCMEKPMDRLVCGDVGYGKTEVAIRAAFKVVQDQKQVAILAPTTLLVDQHLRVFQKRLEKFPVEVEMLSRFRSKKEQKVILEKVKKGDIDIVVGTHRLLSNDVSFRDVGLLIIDEEQRFGVKHKEKIKKMKKTIDVLTLSATPIPRTLHMAFLGIRDISIMNTPPQDRLSIRTHTIHFDEQTIRDAILKEIRRGGQVFFVHNKVKTIAKLTERLQKMVPEAKFQFAHGQMPESQIEKAMLRFINKEFNVLVCTTIIGSGIDISSANTILIDRADQFGLAQLYQLRGRVGRSQERAYAYLIIPEEKKLSQDAKKRLQVIQGAQELGAGFKVASHDLEIRGGGNILGKDQSGEIEAIGFEMYSELLEETVEALKGNQKLKDIEPEINLRFPAFIPEDYMPDPRDKLTFYRHLSMLQSEDELQEIESEMQDRFGRLPEPVYNLFDVMAIKFFLKKLRVQAIDFGNQKAVFTFAEDTPVSPDVIIDYVQKKPTKYQIRQNNRFIVYMSSWKEILPFVRDFVDNHLK
ncbi:MAG: transcription-repair coupling factor [Deltaproteobacteria bacterium RIFCSPHIGHO2_02_FULL_40_11]|nr:MAG: transcription-repair coupling factor [Deltaproteobacteria bacterium RIFCSPHIGHO2_02_FULL_40_11]